MNDKELLGNFFINVGTEKDRSLLVELINKFINLYPKFKPLAENDKYRSYFMNYCKKNDLKLLDGYYFINNPSYNIKGGNNDICICVDGNNIKHVIVKRGYYDCDIKEINNKLGVNTLRDIYTAMVLRIKNPLLIYRRLKDIKSKMNIFKEGDVLNYSYKNNSNKHIVILSKLEFNEKLKKMFYFGKVFEIKCDDIFHNMNRTNGYMLTTLDEMEKFLNVSNIISKQEASKIIEEVYDNKINKILETRESMINSINDF